VKFKVLVVMILTVALISLTGCQQQSPETAQPEKSQQTTQTKKGTLADVLKYFQDNGLETGEVIGKAYDMMGAVEGFGIIVNGEQIELYRIDLKTASEETKQNLESARSLGVYNMSGMSFPVVVNGNIILTRLSEHPEGDKIVEIFKNY